MRSTVSSGSTVEVGKTKTLTVTDRFAVPLGETNNRDLHQNQEQLDSTKTSEHLSSLMV